jgi:hypothetical protein
MLRVIKGKSMAAFVAAAIWGSACGAAVPDEAEKVGRISQAIVGTTRVLIIPFATVVFVCRPDSVHRELSSEMAPGVVWSS